MKTVGKQLQDARLEKGWSPELAARETKIRVDRLHDLESDDYSNFSSPTYARGFVRTYARALGMDEYKILRQLDNKLPEDDNASFANDGGVPYMPEPSQVTKPFEVGKGVYIAAGVGATVLLLIGFILVQVYRAGYFAQALPATASNTTTNSMPVVPDSETAQRALPADSNAPPVALPIDTTTAVATAPAAPVASSVSTPAASAAPVDTNAPLRALPVDPASLAASTNATATAPMAPVVTGTTNAPAANNTGVAATTPSPTTAPAAPSTASAETTTPLDTPTPPRAQPVDPDTLSSDSNTNTPSAPATTNMAVAPVTSPTAPAPEVVPRPAPSISARQSNERPVTPAVAPSVPPDASQTSVAPTSAAPSGPIVADTMAATAPVTDSQAPTNVPAPVMASQAPAEPPASDRPPAPSSLASAAPSATDTIPVAPVAPAAPDSASALTGGDNSATGDVTPSTNPGDTRGKRLVLTASQDSFVRVVALDGSHGDHVRFSSMLHSGQSISFNDRKYSINVGDPAVVDISLDGINYGPHSDHSEPDTFTVESRQP